MNNEIVLDKIPLRIVSLVPSQTELLHHLGLDEEVVGITKFCIKPDEWYRSKDRIGGTKSVNIEKVREFKPDLIIGNKEENYLANIEELRDIAPVWMSDIYTLNDALDMIRAVGELTGKEKESNVLIEEIEDVFLKLETFIKSNPLENNNVIYFIWHAPDMAAGKNTFIDDMLKRCGLVNCVKAERYPEVTPTAIDLTDNPDFILLSSEPYPFDSRHEMYFRKSYPESKIVHVDGEAFSWYGSNLKAAGQYFIELLQKLAL